MNKNGCHRGFTLIELLVVIAIISMGRRPHSNRAAACYLVGMNTLLILVVLLLLFGGGGFYFGGPVIGGGGLGLILLICLVIWVMGGFRTTKS
jgi:prepilin-type N-terminal cleavage/methylation domain-containing protein